MKKSKYKMAWLQLLTYDIKGINKTVVGTTKMHCSVALLQETHLNKEEPQHLKRERVDQVYSRSSGKHFVR